MNATTTDPAVVFGVVRATAGAWLFIALLIRYVVDDYRAYTPATHHTRTPMLPTALADRHPHAQPTTCDETAPITTVQSGRARHRKGSR